MGFVYFMGLFFSLVLFGVVCVCIGIALVGVLVLGKTETLKKLFPRILWACLGYLTMFVLVFGVICMTAAWVNSMQEGGVKTICILFIILGPFVLPWMGFFLGGIGVGQRKGK